MNGCMARRSWRNLARQARSVALVLPVVLACIGTRPAPTLAASLDAEWAAVESVIAPFSPPQALLANVMNATGAEAIGESALLHLTIGQFMQDQDRHPAYLMDSIQGFLSQFWRGDASMAVLLVENVNRSTHLLNLNGLSPADEATLITKIATGPRATSYLQATVQPTATPQAAQPSSSQGPLFPAVDAFLLPASDVGGSLRTVSLPPAGLPSPTKPRSRVEYDVTSSALVYRVSIFNTVSDAQASFRWQTDHLPASQVKRRIPANGESGPIWEYVAGRYFVAAGLYQNIEIATSAPASPKADATVEIVERYLQLQARGYEAMLGTSFGRFIDKTPLMHLFQNMEWGGCIEINSSILDPLKNNSQPDKVMLASAVIGCFTAEQHIAALFGTDTAKFASKLASPTLRRDARVQRFGVASIFAMDYSFRWLKGLAGLDHVTAANLADLNDKRVRLNAVLDKERDALLTAYGQMPTD